MTRRLKSFKVKSSSSWSCINEELNEVLDLLGPYVSRGLERWEYSLKGVRIDFDGRYELEEMSMSALAELLRRTYFSTELGEIVLDIDLALRIPETLLQRVLDLELQKSSLNKYVDRLLLEGITPDMIHLEMQTEAKGVPMRKNIQLELPVRMGNDYKAKVALSKGKKRIAQLILLYMKAVKHEEYKGRKSEQPAYVEDGILTLNLLKLLSLPHWAHYMVENWVKDVYIELNGMRPGLQLSLKLKVVKPAGDKLRVRVI